MWLNSDIPETAAVVPLKGILGYEAPWSQLIGMVLARVTRKCHASVLLTKSIEILWDEDNPFSRFSELTSSEISISDGCSASSQMRPVENTF
ncbi:MAG: hypothetical protein OXN17_02070 [Candidatus Poribacteria bacterium]|nr:hypothetical protein [Candidatus Poribacteria bacterium]MDE0503699.1 hypothetical protein [Candidatus Poribacteria bacterium]